MPTLRIALLAKYNIINLRVNLMIIKTPHFLAFFLNISLLSILPGIFLIGLVIHPPKLCYDRFII